MSSHDADVRSSVPSGASWPSSPTGSVSDEELERLALAADPYAPLDANARPWTWEAPSTDLPDWYMPAAIATRHSRSTRIVVASIIFGFLLIDASGLCITSGFLTLA